MPTMDTQTSIMLAGGVLVLIAVATLIIYKKKNLTGSMSALVRNTIDR